MVSTKFPMNSNNQSHFVDCCVMFLIVALGVFVTWESVPFILLFPKQPVAHWTPLGTGRGVGIFIPKEYKTRVSTQIFQNWRCDRKIQICNLCFATVNQNISWCTVGFGYLDNFCQIIASFHDLPQISLREKLHCVWG